MHILRTSRVGWIKPAAYNAASFLGTAVPQATMMIVAFFVDACRETVWFVSPPR